MACSAVLALLLAAGWIQDPPPPPPTPEEEAEQQEEVDTETAEAIDPEVAAKTLREAFKDKKLAVEDLQAIVEEFGLVEDELVTKELGKGLKHKAEHVRAAVVVALRWNQHPSSFEELLKAKRDKRIKETPSTGVAYALALGQWGAKDAEHAEKSVAVLDTIVDTQDLPHPIIQAAIRALGRCRVQESPAVIMNFLRAGPARARKFITDIRGAMFILLGADLGKKTGDWTDWWSDEGEKMKVPAEPYVLPQERAALDWIELWKSPMQKAAELAEQEEARKRREEARKKRRAAENDF